MWYWFLKEPGVVNIRRCPKLNVVFLRCVLVNSELQLSQDSISKMLKRQAESMYTRLISYTYLTLWAFLSTWVFTLSLVHFFKNVWKPKVGQQKSAWVVLWHLFCLISSWPVTHHNCSHCTTHLSFCPFLSQSTVLHNGKLPFPPQTISSTFSARSGSIPFFLT